MGCLCYNRASSIQPNFESNRTSNNKTLKILKYDQGCTNPGRYIIQATKILSVGA